MDCLVFLLLSGTVLSCVEMWVISLVIHTWFAWWVGLASWVCVGLGCHIHNHVLKSEQVRTNLLQLLEFDDNSTISVLSIITIII